MHGIYMFAKETWGDATAAYTNLILDETALLWHQRLRHTHHRDMLNLASHGLVKGFTAEHVRLGFQCEEYICSKQTQKQHTQSL